MKTFIRKSLKVAFVAIGLAFAINSTASAQATPDTVCAESNEYYAVSSDLTGSTFEWILSGGGTIAFGQGTDSITIDWGTTAGRYNLKVVETSADGCVGDTIELDIDVVDKPTATMTGDNTLCYGEDTDVQVDLTGIAPWTITYAKNGTDTTITGITASPYVFTHSNAANNTGAPITTTYTMGDVDDKYCSNTGTGSATITNNPKPQTSAIRHR